MVQRKDAPGTKTPQIKDPVPPKPQDRPPPKPSDLFPGQQGQQGGGQRQQGGVTDPLDDLADKLPPAVN